MKRQIASIILVLMLVFTMMPLGSIEAYAAGTVSGVEIVNDTLTWDAYTGAAEYHITCDDGKFSYGLTDSSGTSVDLKKAMDDANLNSGTYSIYVSACDANGVITGTKSEAVSYEYTAPASKPRLDAPVLTQNGYVLSWELPKGNADYIYIRIDENINGTWEQVDYENMLPDIAATYLGDGLEPGKTYRAGVFFGANSQNTSNLSSAYSYTEPFNGPAQKIDPKITDAAVDNNGIVTWKGIELPDVAAADISYNVKASGFAGRFDFDAGNALTFDLKTAMDNRGLTTGAYDVNITAKVPKYGLTIYESSTDFMNYSYTMPEPPAQEEPEPVVEKITITEDNTIVEGIKNKVWNGSKRTQTLEVTVDGKVLVKDVDYKVTYKNYVNVGTSTLTIKGLGDYTGSIKKTFAINPKSTTIKSVTAAKNALIIKWKKNSTKMSTKRITGYEIWVSTSSKFTDSSTKKITLKGYKKVSKRVNGLKAKKKYYVKIRTYRTISGLTYYSSWSKYKTKKTK